jgi:hypothetical protein
MPRHPTRLAALMTAVLLVVAFTATIPAQSAAADNKANPKAEAPREIDLRPIAHKKWGNSPEQVRAILLSGSRELLVYFPGRTLKPILVEPEGGPITLFDRGPGGEYRVHLDTDDNLWAQWVYQFSHELGHILSNYDTVRNRNKWFEETVCEVASLFVLRRLADVWSKDPSPGTWKKFAPALGKYADARIAKAQLPDKMTLAEWYPARALDLAKTGYDRDKNTLVAVQLLPLFEETPEHWEAISYLARAKKGHSGSFAEYLKAWQESCPEKHQPFVDRIARKFDIDLAKVTLMPPKE